MFTRMIEATNGPRNWGKFMLGRMSEEEWAHRSEVDGRPLLRTRGWTRNHLWVLDLQTGEGGLFLLGGLARADLNKKQVQVCPLFEPFLEWLYQQDTSDLSALPSLVDLPEAPFMMYGYRRPGMDTSD